MRLHFCAFVTIFSSGPIGACLYFRRDHTVVWRRETTLLSVLRKMLMALKYVVLKPIDVDATVVLEDLCFQLGSEINIWKT